MSCQRGSMAARERVAETKGGGGAGKGGARGGGGEGARDKAAKLLEGEGVEEFVERQLEMVTSSLPVFPLPLFASPPPHTHSVPPT